VNRFRGRITKIVTAAAVSRVGVDVAGELISAVVLETPETASYLRKGNSIMCLFKETEVGLAKGSPGPVSFPNRIGCTVESVEEGELFARVSLRCAGGPFDALIGAPEAAAMGIGEGDLLTALIHPGEISLMVPEDDDVS
jgi:molybdate transport system regulatory protein